jgi:uncharacterized protein YggE
VLKSSNRQILQSSNPPILKFAVAICLVAAAASAQPAPPADPRVPTVVTHGEATVKRAPDRAFIDLAVETRAQTPMEATTRNAQLMTAVQEKVRALGIAADAVRTRGYQLNPEFDYVNGRQVSRGYVARNEIEVRIDKLEQLGVVIDTAIAAGATNAGAVRFDLRGREGLEREALKLAVADARARADAAAAGAGSSVTRVLKIEEGGRSDIPPPMPYMAAARMEAKQAMPTPIAAGEIEIRATVTLTAELKP